MNIGLIFYTPACNSPNRAAIEASEISMVYIESSDNPMVYVGDRMVDADPLTVIVMKNGTELRTTTPCRQLEDDYAFLVSQALGRLGQGGMCAAARAGDADAKNSAETNKLINGLVKLLERCRPVIERELEDGHRIHRDADARLLLEINTLTRL